MSRESLTYAHSYYLRNAEKWEALGRQRVQERIQRRHGKSQPLGYAESLPAAQRYIEALSARIRCEAHQAEALAAAFMGDWRRPVQPVRVEPMAG